MLLQNRKSAVTSGWLSVSANNYNADRSVAAGRSARFYGQVYNPPLRRVPVWDGAGSPGSGGLVGWVVQVGAGGQGCDLALAGGFGDLVGGAGAVPCGEHAGEIGGHAAVDLDGPVGGGQGRQQVRGGHGGAEDEDPAQGMVPPLAVRPVTVSWPWIETVPVGTRRGCLLPASPGAWGQGKSLDSLRSFRKLASSGASGLRPTTATGLPR